MLDIWLPLAKKEVECPHSAYTYDVHREVGTQLHGWTCGNLWLALGSKGGGTGYSAYRGAT